MIDRRSSAAVGFCPAAPVVVEKLEDRRLLSASPSDALAHAHLTRSVLLAPAAAQAPTVTTVNPAAGATGVSRDTDVTAEVMLPNGALDATTVTSANVTLTRNSDQASIPVTVNTTGGGDAIILTPVSTLDANTAYTFHVTSGVKDVSGTGMTPFSETFTTGSTGGITDPNIGFTKVALDTATGAGFDCVRIGPDGLLYASSTDGRIFRFPINSDGTLGTPQIITSIQTANGGNRLITGFAFDPSSTANNVKLWVSNSFFALSGATNGVDLTGKITVLSGANLDTVQDAVVHLPRSVADHSTEQPVFGPDGALYFCQGSDNAFGAPDNTWGNRPEHLLSAAILRLDTTKLNLAQGPLDALTPDVGGTYNPSAPGAALTIYATGVRNVFQLMWDANGTLWAPGNGSSAGGNAPAFNHADPTQVNGKRVDTGLPYAGPDVPALTNIQQVEDDFMLKIVPGKYYGHPNPSRGEFVLDGGNPTSGGVADQVFTAYPAGTNPDPNFQPASFDLGPHHSPDGIIQYTGGAFNGALSGKILIAEESAGDDVVVLSVDANDNVVSADRSVSGLSGFKNPVNLAEDPTTGNLYVAEIGAGKLTLLRPNTPPVTTPSAPVGVVPTATSAPAQVTLNWTASAGASSYRVERAGPGSGTFAEIASGVTATTFTDSNVSAGASYQYRVRAENSSGLSPYSAVQPITVPTTTVALPASPTTLQATPAGGQVGLTWDAVPGAAGYRVERQGPGDATFVEIASAVSNSSFTDATVAKGATYQYRVRAQNAAGLSGYSPTATADVPTTPTADVAIGKGGVRSVQFTAANGTLAVFTLTGPGTATVHFSGDSIGTSKIRTGTLVGGTNLSSDSITATGTTAATTLTITTRGGAARTVSLGGISTDGSFRSITAGTTRLTGNLSVPGTLGRVTLASAANGAIAVGGAGLALSVGTLTAEDLTAGGAVRTLTAGTWTGGTITAPSVTTVSVSHDATFTLKAGSVRSVRVGGTLSGSTLNLSTAGVSDLASMSTRAFAGSTINAAGNLGSLSLGRMTNANVYAGVATLTTGQLLPQSAADFIAAASIGAVRLRRVGGGGSSYVNSSIAASRIGSASLGTVQAGNAGIPFGLATSRVTSLAFTDTASGKSVNLRNVTTAAQVTAAAAAKAINLQDFAIRIV